MPDDIDELESLVAKLKDIMKELGGRLPSPDEHPDFWEIVDEIYEYFIKARKTSWGGLARQLGVNENTLKSYYRRWKTAMSQKVGLLPPALARLIYEKMKKELKQPFDRITAEFVSEVVEYGLIVKKEFEHIVKARGKDPKEALIEALVLYVEHGDKIKHIIDENEKLRKAVAVQQLALREMELALKGLVSTLVRRGGAS